MHLALLMTMLLSAPPDGLSSAATLASIETPPAPSLASVEVMDRAIQSLDLRRERHAWLLAHPDSLIPSLPGQYVAEITVEDRARELAPEIREYKMLPLLGQLNPALASPAMRLDALADMPWWRY